MIEPGRAPAVTAGVWCTRLCYDPHMKYLISFMILVSSLQPLQAGGCAMDAQTNGGHDTHHMAEADKMNAARHSCCDPAAPMAAQDCNQDMSCGSCHVSAAAPLSVNKLTIIWAMPGFRALSSGVVAPSHAAPPFKPPIA